MGKPTTLEAVMAQQVLKLYLNTMKNNREFQEAPNLDLYWFKKHFATVAHEHNLVHGDGIEARERYNIYFRLVRGRLSKAIKHLAKEQEQAQATRVRLTLPQQIGLPSIPVSKR